MQLLADPLEIQTAVCPLNLHPWTRQSDVGHADARSAARLGSFRRPLARADTARAMGSAAAPRSIFAALPPSSLRLESRKQPTWPRLAGVCHLERSVHASPAREHGRTVSAAFLGSADWAAHRHLGQLGSRHLGPAYGPTRRQVGGAGGLGLARARQVCVRIDSAAAAFNRRAARSRAGCLLFVP